MTDNKNQILYKFTAVPKYFKNEGWTKDPNISSFLLWAFDRCWHIDHTATHDHRQIFLKANSFIFGIHKCSEECGVSVQSLKTIIKNFIFDNILTDDTNSIPLRYPEKSKKMTKNKLSQPTEFDKSFKISKKSTNRLTNRFTIYTWNTSLFFESPNQQTNQLLTNSQPTPNHKQEQENKDMKEITQEAAPVVVFSFFSEFKLAGLTDKEKIKICSMHSEEYIRNAIAAFEEAKSENEPHLKTFRGAIKGGWKPSKTFHTLDDNQKNFDLAGKLEFINHAYTFRATREGLEISGGQMVPKIIPYTMTHENFIKSIEKSARINIYELFNLQGAL